MTDQTEAISHIDWKEIGITAAISFITATAAVVVAQMLIIPALTKAKEKRAAKDVKSKP